ncbi:MAG: N-acetylglucosamine kinase [Rhodobacteraceae bacterium]|nr:N-acetylglucosamine kinase [Paracoccaceae bacterium]
MTRNPSYLLAGVDGGGTGCRVAIIDANGARVGEARGGPANFNSNPALTIRSVREALQTAAADAGLDSDWQSRCTAHVGLAGIMSPQDAETMASALTFGQVAVTDDRVTSVAGALGDRDGMLAAIGTGTIVAGQTGSALRFFGGWGNNLADQASGAWLGRTALRRTMLAHDGLQAHSPLTQALLARFGSGLSGIVAFATAATPGDFAGLARTVIEAADAGDATGRTLMQHGAAYLDRCIDTNGLAPGAALCLAGGVGPHYAPYLAPAHQAHIQPAQGTALDGALRLAAKAFDTQRGSA